MIVSPSGIIWIYLFCFFYRQCKHWLSSLYIHQNVDCHFESPSVLRGDASDKGRFGSSLAVLPDLNSDGLSDLAVGAPLENSGQGSIYIFHGEGRGRISLTYSQVSRGLCHLCFIHMLTKKINRSGMYAILLVTVLNIMSIQLSIINWFKYFHLHRELLALRSIQTWCSSACQSVSRLLTLVVTVCLT